LAHAHRQFQIGSGQPNADTNSYSHSDADPNTDAHSNSNPDASADTHSDADPNTDAHSNSNPNPSADTHSHSDTNTDTKLFAVDQSVVQDSAAGWRNRLLYRDNRRDGRIQFTGVFVRERSSLRDHRKLQPESRHYFFNANLNCQLFHRAWDIRLYRHRYRRQPAFNAPGDGDTR